MNERDGATTKEFWLGLREALHDGVSSMHSGVEAAAVRDAARPVDASAIQAIARGTEVLGKAVWILNRLRDGADLPSPAELKTRFRHRVSDLIRAIVEQVSSREEDDRRRYDHTFLAHDPILRAVLEVADDFGKQGRYRHLDSLTREEDLGLPIHLAWNGLVEPEIARLPGSPRGADSDGAARYLDLRHHQVETLQRLLRSLCRQAIDAQTALGMRPAHGAILRLISDLDDDRLAECVPLDDFCRCATPDPRVAFWAPVQTDRERSTD